MPRKEPETIPSILVLLTAVCLLLAGLHVYNETWVQWSTRYGWVNLWTGSVHSLMFFAFVAVILCHVALLIGVGLWWLKNRKDRFFAVWSVLLLVTALLYLPSDRHYLTVTQWVLGPK